MNHAQAKLTTNSKEVWRELDGVVSMAERCELEVEPCSLLAKQQQERLFRSKHFNHACEDIFCQVIGGRVVAPFERIRVPVAFSVHPGELSALRRNPFRTGHCSVLCLKSEVAGNHIRIDVWMPDS